jgi:adenylosuccinate synthase
MAGYSDVLVGLQYGDEGKARIIDMLAKDYDIIARFNGGANAGHTIQTEKGKIALHQIPSGVFYPEIELYIGSGCVVNVEKLVDEINSIKKLGINIDGRLHISAQATIIQPYHLLVDGKAGKGIGTTMNGIGPAYADQALRVYGKRLLNIRLGDLLHDFGSAMDYIKENLKAVSEEYELDDQLIDELAGKLGSSFKIIAPFVEKDTLFLDKQVRAGKRILFEGAQSFMLDVVKGTVPFVTSSHTMAGHAYVGGDLSPGYHRKTIGVAKAIMSRVGNGPFVSELGGKESEEYCMEDGGKAHSKQAEAGLPLQKMLASKDMKELGIALRILGDEYGASTGRPRRIGMLDLVQLAYAARINGVDDLYMNKCDMLMDFSKSSFGGIPLVTKYTLAENEINYVPGSTEEYNNVAASTTIFPCFCSKISGLRNASEIPKELRSVISHIEKFCDCKIKGIGVGPAREQFVML